MKLRMVPRAYKDENLILVQSYAQAKGSRLVDQAQEVASAGLVHAVSYPPFQDLINQFRSTWTCADDIAGAALS